MSDAQDLLIEIGTEELPPKALRELRDAFAREVTRGLEEAGFKVGRVRPMPRRAGWRCGSGRCRFARRIRPWSAAGRR